VNHRGSGAEGDELRLAGEEQAIFSVAELTERIRDALEEGIGEVWVAGEISNFRNPGSGHLYFTVKDETATLNAVMFRGAANRLGFALKDGLAILVRGTITVYAPRGQYQIQAVEIKPRGQGTLQQRFEALKKKLADEGLFEMERKRELPAFPEVIGVVTALQGAVLQDISRILKRRAPGIRVEVRGVRVQGAEAAGEIVEAIEAFNRDARVEVIVVARGGGSLEDLWAFNEELVARALAASRLPIVSAVGHETDVTIADFVADVRAATPSAAAEILSQGWVEAGELLDQLSGRMERGAGNAVKLLRARCAELAGSYVFREPRRVVQQFQQRLDDLAMELGLGLRRAAETKRHGWDKIWLRWRAVDPIQRLRQERERVGQWEARLRALGPEATLQRGYALVLDQSGNVVREANKNLMGKDLNVRLAKGTLNVQVKDIE
jgi:exodeoxyribonuclease VII large subunit